MGTDTERKHDLRRALGNRGWLSSDDGELVRQNLGGVRRWVYMSFEEDDGVWANLEMNLRGEEGWERVVGMFYRVDAENNEGWFLTLPARWGRELMMVCYNANGVRESYPTLFAPDFGGQVGGERKELYWAFGETPREIDVELTMTLFQEQVIYGEMDRPLLVPKGLFSTDPCGRYPVGPFIDHCGQDAVPLYYLTREPVNNGEQRVVEAMRALERRTLRREGEKIGQMVRRGGK